MFSFIQKPSAVLFTAIISLALVRVATAQTTVPECADGCVTIAVSAVGCSDGDNACSCQSPTFISSVLQCSAQNCTSAQQAAVSSALGDICGIVTFSSGLPGSSTGTSSGTQSDNSASSSSTTDSGVITITTLSGGSTTTVTATFSTSATPSPPISFRSSIPIIGPSTLSRPTPTTATTTAISTVISPSSISSSGISSITRPVTTLTTTSASANGVSTAPPSSSTTNGSARTLGVMSGLGGVLCLGLGLAGAMAVLNAL